MTADELKKLDEFVKVLDMQEEILQFTHFTNQDAWELGSIMALEARKRNLPVAIRIELNNGFCVFQYAADGTTPRNQMWLERKINTVKLMEKSSLNFYASLRKAEQSMEDVFLDEKEYACCGGAFPIRIEDASVLGTIAVSGLNHVRDHDFIVKCVSKYLHADEVPRIKENM